MRVGEILKELSIGSVLVAYLLLTGGSWHSLWDPCLTLLSAVLLWIPSTFAHEFGHALAGRTLGFRLNYIRVGTGGTFSIGPRVKVGPNLWRTGGITTFQPSSRPMTRTGAVFLYGAGALVNLALVSIALFLIPIQSNVGWGLLFVNFAQFILSLIPSKSNHKPGGWNDGANIWVAIRGE